MTDENRATKPVDGLRRSLFLGMGAAAAGAVATVAGSSSSADAMPIHEGAKPTKKKKHSKVVGVVNTVGSLAKKKAANGDVVAVLGYAEPGDITGLFYRCVSKKGPKANGGTVVSGRKGTVWELLHGGVAEFRNFGIFDAGTAADDALDAMLEDSSIHRIEAHTPLNFTRRHTTSRSRIALDFGNHLVTAEGIEKAGEDDPFAAVMFFRGEVTADSQTGTLGETVPDLSDVFPVADSSFFTVGTWYAVEVNALSGKWERELQKLVQVTEIVDGTHIRINYQNGWPLGDDRSITWTRIKPVHDVSVSRIQFRGGGADQYTGSHPLAFEYAVRCDVDHIVGSKTFWPVIMRRWNTYYSTTSSSLSNPTSVTYGGAGYMTQQIYCLYGYVANCHTSNARHLNDFTASAYSLVENCHGDGDDQGPFVTHGQYEHDLTYTGNSGLMTFANSGEAWGGAAKRITVRKHVCSWFVARVKVTDLTLEDVRVIGKASLKDSGMLWVNADGVQLRGCTATHTLIVTQSSNASTRPNVISDSAFAFAAAGELTNDTVTQPVTFVDTTLSSVGGMTIGGTGDVVFRNCRITADDGSEPVTSSAALLRLEGSTLNNVSIVAGGDSDGSLEIISGSRLSESAVSRSGDGARSILLADSAFSRAKGNHITMTEGENHYRAIGCRFDGGALELDSSAFAEPSSLLQIACIENGTSRTGFPDDSNRVVTTGNITL